MVRANAGSDLLDLVEADLDRGLAAEDRHEDLELRGVLVDLGDLAGEVRQRAGDDLDRLADRELRLRRDLRGDLAVQQAVDLGLGERHRLVRGADESGDAGRALDELPRVVVELHVHEDVAGHRPLLHGRLLVVLHLGHGLGRDDDLAHSAALVQRLRAVLEVLLDLVLVSGVGVDDVPAIHGFLRAGRGRLAAERLDDEVDDFLGDAIGDAEVEAGNHHEAEHDGGGLRDLAAIRPLYALELRPRGAKEGGKARGHGSGRRGGPGRGLGAGAPAPPDDAAARGGDLGVVLLVEVLEIVGVDLAGRGRVGLERVLDELLVLDLVRALVGRHLVIGRRHVAPARAGASDERGVELVRLAGGVLELAGDVRPMRLGPGRAGVLASAARLALLGSLTVTGHDGSPRLAGLPVARVRPAPLAVLAQRDAVGVVALALVRLVVAPLALLACEGDSDAHVSAGHTPLRDEMWADRRRSGQKNDPPRASRDRV